MRLQLPADLQPRGDPRGMGHSLLPADPANDLPSLPLISVLPLEDGVDYQPSLYPALPALPSELPAVPAPPPRAVRMSPGKGAPAPPVLPLPPRRPAGPLHAKDCGVPALSQDLPDLPFTDLPSLAPPVRAEAKVVPKPAPAPPPRIAALRQANPPRGLLLALSQPNPQTGSTSTPVWSAGSPPLPSAGNTGEEAFELDDFGKIELPSLEPGDEVKELESFASLAPGFSLPPPPRAVPSLPVARDRPSRGPAASRQSLPSLTPNSAPRAALDRDNPREASDTQPQSREPATSDEFGELGLDDENSQSLALEDEQDTYSRAGMQSSAVQSNPENTDSEAAEPALTLAVNRDSRENVRPGTLAQPLDPALQRGAAVRKRKLIVTAACVLSVGIAGGAMSLSSALGPFGAYALSDWLNQNSHSRAFQQQVNQAQAQLAQDEHSAMLTASTLLYAAQAQAPRYESFTIYAAYLDCLTLLRHGASPEQRARAQVALDALAPHDVADPSLLALAKALLLAVEGKRQEAIRALSERGDDPSALLALGELLLQERDSRALEVWQKLEAQQATARTLFGRARAHYLLGQNSLALTFAERTLAANPRHVGASLLVARLRGIEGSQEAIRKLAAGAVQASPGERVEAHFLLGRLGLEQGNVSAAEEQFRAALAIEPTAAEALWGLGEAFYRTGRFSEGLGRFEAALDADRDSLEGGLGAAKSMLKLERAGDAKRVLEVLATKHAGQRKVDYWLGQVNEALGQREAAEGNYKAAIASAPVSGAVTGSASGAVDSDSATVIAAYVALARLQSSAGADALAEQTLLRARETLPASTDLYCAMGEVAIGSGKPQAALEHFEAALRLTPADLRARFLLGTAERRLERYDRALATLDAVSAKDPHFPGLHFERGLLYEALGRSGEALGEYEAALAKAPNDSDLMLRVGCAKVAAGLGTEAEEGLMAVSLLRPTSAEVHHCLGRALMLQGKTNLALKNLRRATEFDDNRAEYQLYVGWAANTVGDAALADVSLGRALQLDQGLADAYWQRGALRRRQGAIKDALNDLTRALTLKPSRLEVHADLADTYYDLGREQSALEHWQKAIDADGANQDWRFRFGKLLLANLRHEQAAQNLLQAIALAQDDNPEPLWLWEAHYLAARALGGQASIVHWQYFLQRGPRASPYRDEAKRALASLGRPWQGDP